MIVFEIATITHKSTWHNWLARLILKHGYPSSMPRGGEKSILFKAINLRRGTLTSDSSQLFWKKIRPIVLKINIAVKGLICSLLVFLYIDKKSRINASRFNILQSSFVQKLE